MPSPASNTLVFFVNGKKVEDSLVDPECSLLHYLRTKLRLCGTKLGCSEGGCGACTVMVSQYDRRKKVVQHRSLNACLAPVCSMHGLAVTTVEGIGSTKGRLHPVQERLYKSHGSQCGFCTPGIVMSMYTLLRNQSTPKMEDIGVNLQGNLCRCTGYRPILQGFQSFASETCCGGGKGNGCCKNGNGFTNGTEEHTNGKDDEVSSESSLTPNGYVPYDASQEPIFPPELQISDAYDTNYLIIKGQKVTWHRPTTLNKLLELKTKYPEAKLIVGNTEIGIEMKFKNCLYPVLIAANAVPELSEVSKNKNGITFGAATTLSELEEKLSEAIKKEPETKTRIFEAFLEMLKWFAGKQIRNMGSLAGNIMTASPISDLNPLFVAARAELKVLSKGGSRTIIMDEEFFPGYRKTLLKPNEILLSVTIPYSTKNEFFYGFKQAQRREDDIAIVNAGMKVRFQEKQSASLPTVQQIDLVFGGMGSTTLVATNTCKQLENKAWNEQLLSSACQLLLDELTLDSDAPGGMVKFRRTLTLGFFFKFYLKVIEDLQKNQIDIGMAAIPSKYRSVTNDFVPISPKASQLFQIIGPGQRSEDPVGRPIPHQSGALHATGEAVYCDDIPLIEGELHLGFVISPKAHARIVSIDTSSAMVLKGVHTFVCAEDFPDGKNTCGIIASDEEYCASQKVMCQGQIVGAVVAETKSLAQKAAKLVRVHYEELKPILSIEDAIAAESYFESETQTMTFGDIQQGFKDSDHVIEGQIRVGGQEHFYMETQCGRAVPGGEHDELVVTLSGQSLQQAQLWVAKALGISANKVVVKCKRLGGGFGGKETRAPHYAVIASAAAVKLQRPVRYMLDRDEDMIMTGGRHPFLVSYKVGFTSEGKLLALQGTAYNNGGHVLDLSGHVMEMFLAKLDNAYNIPHVEFHGYVCKTNVPTNTAYRGFGAPQAAIFLQSLLMDIGTYLHIEPTKIREINLHKDGDKCLTQQKLVNCTVGRCWQECLQQSDYSSRKAAVNQFNKENRWKKRGIAVVPMSFGAGFAIQPLNQGAALVHIYTDGTVLISHGGVEMGQGLHTKLIQVASRVLGIPSDKIHVSDTSTDRVPNAVQSAGSLSSDLFGAAVMKACQELMERLKPYMDANPKDAWDKWVLTAYLNRTSLSATGFYATRSFKEIGGPFQYHSYGAACSEVEIDCLTGDHRVLRTDIVMDVGESLNPAVDIGQIEGAFIQGYGMCTMEELRYSPEGTLYTRGPGTYKIPGFGDIPSEFNVSLLKGSSNVHAIYSSKAIGEPPLLLSASVFCAIKEAILSSRAEVGESGYFRLDSPATAERIRMSCADHFTQQVDKATATSGKAPWAIQV